MRCRYDYEEAKVTGRPPGIEMHPYDTGEDFERASVGIVEGCGRHGPTKNPVSDRVYLDLEGRGTFYFGGEEGEAVTVGKDDALLIPKGTVYDYEGQTRLLLSHSPAYAQDSDVCYDDLWE